MYKMALWLKIFAELIEIKKSNKQLTTSNKIRIEKTSFTTYNQISFNQNKNKNNKYDFY